MKLKYIKKQNNWDLFDTNNSIYTFNKFKEKKYGKNWLIWIPR